MTSYSLSAPDSSMYISSYVDRRTFPNYRYTSTEIVAYGKYDLGYFLRVNGTWTTITSYKICIYTKLGNDAPVLRKTTDNHFNASTSINFLTLSSSLTAYAQYEQVVAADIDNPSFVYGFYSSKSNIVAPYTATPSDCTVSKIQANGATLTWPPVVPAEGDSFVAPTSYYAEVLNNGLPIASFSNITSPAFLSFSPEPTKFYDFSINSKNYVGQLESSPTYVHPKQYEAAPTSVTSLSLTDFYPSSTTQNVSVTWLGGLGGSNTVNFMFGTSTMPYLAATYDNVNSGAYLSLTTTPGYQYSFVVTSSNQFGSVTSTNSNVVYTDLSTVTSPCISYMDKFYQSVTWGRIAGNVTYDVLTFIGSTTSFSDSVYQGKKVNVQPGTGIFNSQRDDFPYNFITVNAIAETGAQSSSEPSVPFYWKKTSTDIPSLDFYYLNDNAFVAGFGFQDSTYGLNCSSYIYSLYQNTISSTNGMTFLKTDVVSPVNYNSDYRNYIFVYPRYTPGMYYMCQLQYVDNIGQRKFVRSKFHLKG